MPMGDSFVRFINSSRERYGVPCDSHAKPDRNSLISELSFRIYNFGLSNKYDIQEISIHDLAIKSLAEGVVKYISAIEKSIAIAPMTESEITEAKNWSLSLSRFTRHVCPSQKITVQPRFNGCGILDACEGDLLIGTTLWELKNVERDFRLADIKQLLAYCSLNYASQQFPIDSIGLVNAKQGLYFKTKIGPLAAMASAMSESELLGEIVRYITSDTPSR